MKRCSRCQAIKPATAFHRNGGGELRPECATCYNARRRERWTTERTVRLARQRAYRERVGRDAWAERNRAWRDANPAYYADNVDRLREQGREKAARRRARQRGLPTERIEHLVVLERHDGVCGICGTDVDPFEFQIDHVVPIAAGGPHLYSNIQLAHPVCNQRKGDRT
jgi:5-methylcytosine-specific restriction endonuclease McrA